MSPLAVPDNVDERAARRDLRDGYAAERAARRDLRDAAERAARRDLRDGYAAERAARRDLRDQIARLERELAETLVASFPRREPPRSGRSASAQAGPRLLTLGQLERIRDELADRVESLHSNPAVCRLEQMLLAPERHRWETVTSADLGEPGCRYWQVRPRLGLVGMLMGWWRVKISSGCPLAG